jgi:hypothetical protein
MSEAPYDSRPDTLEHIGKVAANLRAVRENLLQRAEEHDQSKLVSPEVEAFDVATPKLQHLEYGSDEYKQSLKDLGPALDHHLSHNRHHPEFHDQGISGMTLLDLIEMLCDWKAASERMRKPTPSPEGQAPVPKYDSDFERSIDLNQQRFGYTDELCSILKNTARELGYI